MSERPNIVPPRLETSEPLCALPGWYDVQASKATYVPALNGRLTGRPIPLSFAQHEIWQHSKLVPCVPLYNQILIFERIGPINLEALERSFNELTRRHETLRTIFPVIQGIPIPTLVEQHAIELQQTELAFSSDQQRKAEILRIATEDARKPFDLRKRLLMRAHLLQVSQEKCFLVVILHSLIADEWSLNPLSRELVALYQAHSTGSPSSLPDLPIHYSDHVDLQKSWLQSDVVKQRICYWRERLAGIPPVLELPADRPRPPVPTFRSAYECFKLCQSLSASIKNLSEQEGVALFIVLLAAFQVLLSRYSGQNDIVVGSIVDGRDGVRTEGLIGRLAHTMITRTDTGGDPTFRELLQRVRDAVRRDKHQTVPLDLIASEIQSEPDASRNPLFQVMFSLTPSVSLGETGWQTRTLEVDTCMAKVDLQLQLCDEPNGIVGRFTYNTDLFDTSTVIRTVGHFQTLLQGIVANPDQCVSKLPLLTQAERHQLLVEWNDQQTDYPGNRCVHHLFEMQVNRNPDGTAVVFENQRLSYRDLNRRANQLARHLLKVGVSPDVPVGICVERSLEMVVGLLGILKAGGAYVPLDPAYPHERLSFMLEDAQVPVLLTQERVVKGLPASSAKVVCMDTDWHAITGESDENPAGKAQPEDLAYVIYTSGSTGKPKGVQIPHRAVVNFLTSMGRRPGMIAGDRLLAVTTLSFDIAGLEIYLPLSVGASVEIVSREVSTDGDQLLSKLASSGATVLQATPATWRLLLEAGWHGSKDLKVLCGGEVMPRELSCELLKRASSVWNMYGPTETTIWSTISRITPGDGPITVGRPIANTEIYVLDSHLAPVPVGVQGELYIGGDGVARGYLHRPELTAEKFIPNPFGEQKPGARLYRTGDLVRYRPNGDVECLGRIDHQVKVRGFRIELGEIESVLGQHPAVRQNAVIVREDSPGDKRLVAYVVASNGQSLTTGGLRAAVRQKLPEYMLPSRFVFLEALPLTPNGKVDRRALPVPEGLQATPEKEYVRSTDDLETRLAKIWASVLGIRTVGIKENFLELGGHSLLVAKLLRQIEREFGKKLSMAALFQAPTVQQQADMLRNTSVLQRPSAVVPIQPYGSRPPFFCFGFNAGPVFLPLARRLGSDQPLLSIDPTLLELSQLPGYKIEDIAACLVRQIRELQPEGPYYVGGFCSGGLMAYECSRQLIAQGQDVALLALFEPLSPAHPAGRSNGSRFGLLGQRLKFHLENLRQLEIKELWPYIRNRAITLFQYVKGLSWRVSYNNLRARISNDRPQHIDDVLYLASLAYRPEFFPGRLTLFQATSRPGGSNWDRQCWRELAATLEVHEIPGYSNWVVQFFLDPTVELLAKILSDRLARCVLPEAKMYEKNG